MRRIRSHRQRLNQLMYTLRCFQDEDPNVIDNLRDALASDPTCEWFVEHLDSSTDDIPTPSSDAEDELDVAAVEPRSIPEKLAGQVSGEWDGVNSVQLMEQRGCLAADDDDYIRMSPSDAYDKLSDAGTAAGAAYGMPASGDTRGNSVKLFCISDQLCVHWIVS